MNVVISFEVNPKSFRNPWLSETFFPRVSIRRLLVYTGFPENFFLRHLGLTSQTYINADFVQVSFEN